MLNNKNDLSTIPTINNDGHSYIIPMDMYKEGYWAYNISNYFKARVDDNGTPFMIRWYKHGQLANVLNLRPFIRGRVGGYTIDDSSATANPKIVMDEDASTVDWTGETTDTQAGGIAVYKTVNQCYPQDGIFYGQVGLRSSDGDTVVTGIDIIFKVLNGNVNMLGARQYYVSELTKALLDFEAKMDKHDRDYQAKLTQQEQAYQAKMDQNGKDFKAQTDQLIADARAAYTKETQNTHDALTAAQAQIQANRDEQADLSNRLAGTEQQIKIHSVVTKDHFKAVSEQLTNSITDKLAKLNAPIPWLPNEAAIKAKYPDGSNSAAIAADTQHIWIYNNGWVDAGQYDVTHADPNDSYYDIIAYWDSGKIGTFNASDAMCNLDLSNVEGVSLRGRINAANIKSRAIDFTKQQLLDAFNACANCTVTGDIITGSTFALVYSPIDEKISVVDPNVEEITPDNRILFFHWWGSVTAGPLVTNSMSASLQQVNDNTQGIAYVWNDKFDYRDNSNDPDLIIGDGLTFMGEDECDVDHDAIIKAAKASSAVTVDDNNHIHGNKFKMMLDTRTKQLRFVPFEDQPNQFEVTVFAHTYAINMGLLANRKVANRIKQANYKYQVSAYIWGGKEFNDKYTARDGAGALFVGDGITIVTNVGRIDITLDQLFTAAKEAADKKDSAFIREVDPDRHLITGQAYSIVYDLDAGKVLFVTPGSGVAENQILLYQYYYASDAFGPMADYALRRDRRTGSTMVDYWKTNVESAEDRINSAEEEAGISGMSFLWIADTHWDGNFKRSPMLVKHVIENTNIQLAANGGDVFNEGTADYMHKSAIACVRAFDQPGIFTAMVCGNHDNNGNNNNKDVFSYSQIYGQQFSYMLRQQNLVNGFKWLNPGVDFTYTFTVKTADNQVWRYISMDSGFDGYTGIPNKTSLDEVAKLLNQSKNEKIIILMHIWSDYGKHTAFADELAKVLDARNDSKKITTENFGPVDFTSADQSSQIIACFGGHDHHDWSWRSEEGIPIIITDSDNADRTETTEFSKAEFTTGEQCFDVMTIDPSHNKIYATRIGRGKDREWTIRETQAPVLTTPAQQRNHVATEIHNT